MNQNHGNYNTIYELSNEEYSRGGYSSSKKPAIPPFVNSKAEGDHISLAEDEELRH